MPKGQRWTHHELFLALNLYHKLAFGQLHARQPAIIALAKAMKRSANSLAMKLVNFASLDPALQIRGIKGLPGTSALDRTVWLEFHQNLNEAVPASEEAMRQLFKVSESSELEVLPKEGIRIKKAPPTGPTEVTANVKIRRGQEYFRNAVLNNFDARCGISGIAIRDLLVASHILPWGKHEEERLNIQNGLCLSRLHDAAFDRGLITFDADLRLMLSSRIKDELPHRIIKENFGIFSGEKLRLPPEAILPDDVFLQVHRSKIFQKN